jgi:hypothetical protein
MAATQFGPYEFSLTDAEYAQSRREAERRVQTFHGSELARRAPVLLVGAAAVILGAGLAAVNVLSVAMAVGFVVAMLAALFASQWLFAWQIRRLAQRTEVVTKARSATWTVEVSEEGIVLDTAEMRAQIRWAAVEDVALVGGLVFIWLRSLRYVSIPLRLAGADRAELVAFVRLHKGGSTLKAPVFGRPASE